MRALVTGGAGFIGSNLVDRLVAEGHEVTVLDDLSTGRRENLPEGVNLVERDVSAAAELARDSDVVFHLAAQIDVRKSVTNPWYDLGINAGGMLAVLEGARESGAKVVFASTGGAIYGETEQVPTPEDAPQRPLAPYGMSKLAAEGYCGLYERLYGVRCTVLRFANVYGPRQDPLGEGGVVAIFCGRILAGEEAVIFGDGRQTRDFVYVGDVVDACLAAAGHDAFGPFNIGTGRETSVLELAAALREVTGDELAARHEAERAGEVRRSCLDVRRAAEELGWRPQTSLHDGLRDTMAWAHQSVT
jgi:UDP-glucose 4-epimerase